MKTKTQRHTLGPNHRKIKSCCGLGGVDKYYIVVDRNNNFVAKTYSMTEARLISAAPDYDREAKLSEDTFSELESWLEQQDQSSIVRKHLKSIGKRLEGLRAAIAKAEGRS